MQECGNVALQMTEPFNNNAQILVQLTSREWKHPYLFKEMMSACLWFKLIEKTNDFMCVCVVFVNKPFCNSPFLKKEKKHMLQSKG